MQYQPLDARQQNETFVLFHQELPATGLPTAIFDYRPR